MEIGPILRALSRHKTGTFLVALQIAVSLAIMVNAAFIVSQRVEKMNRPTGMDVENIIAVSIRGVGQDYDALANIRRDLDWIRNHPDVVAATKINQIPLSGSGSGSGLRTEPVETAEPVNLGRWEVDEHGLETLGANLVRGRNFRPEEIRIGILGETDTSAPAVVIVTQDLVDELFGEGADGLGRTVYWGDDAPSEIIGIIDHMHGSWVAWDGLGRNLLMPDITVFESARYLIRTKPGRRDAFMGELEDGLVALNANRVIRWVRSHEEIAARTYETDRAMADMLIAVIVLLVGLTALVIVGLASWFVSQRTRQIGTRRALGATRLDIVRYFLIENCLITTLGAVGGVILTVAVAYWLETTFELPRLDWRYLLAAVFALWTVGLLAASWPALRASRVAPAVATRNV
ncbi:MAG: FtsX-like permease family protein [Pseudomonadales bacterium]|jgi:putative ABC transport system permease protein|nr:FtsX-like permease family protein [Pseudomonadales bacterium]